jgi:glycosyltransferase 2 family protein
LQLKFCKLKTKIKNFAAVFIPILLGAGLTYYTYKSFSDEQRAQMLSYFTNANYNFILISLFWATMGYVFRAYRWKYTLQKIGVTSNFTLNFFAVSVGYFVNLSIPRSGEVSRALILKKYQNAAFDKVFGTIIAERIVDFAIVLLFIFMAIFLEFNTLRDFLLLYIPISKLLVLMAVGTILLIIGLLVYKYSKIKFILVLKSKIEGLKEGALSVWNLPNKGPFLAHTLLIWISYVLMFYFATFALNATNSITLGAVLVAFIIGSLTIAFTNGGFGFFPVLIAQILVLYHVPKEAGIAFGWIVWISQLVITVFFGVVGFLFLPMFKNNIQPVSH